jgi:Putative auto-transporter adhesin, head GIN domain
MNKTIVLTALLYLFGLAGISQKNKIPLPEMEKDIPVSSFDQLIIDGIFNLTLVENDEPAIQVKGSPRFVKAFKIYQRQKSLLVRSFYANENLNNNQVTINVRKLKNLTVRQAAVVNTNGVLQSENCLVKIINNGATIIKPGENFDLVVLP